jgi:hypothetical protein
MRAILFVIFLVALNVSAFSQPALVNTKASESGIEGVVRDKAGAWVLGAKIIARSSTGKEFSTVSDKRGIFSLSLAGAVYTLEVHATGLKSLFSENHSISGRGRGRIDFIMGIDESTFDLEPCGVGGDQCHTTEGLGPTEEIKVEPTVPSSRISFRQKEKLPAAPVRKSTKTVKKNNK